MQGWVSPPPIEDGYYRYSKADKLIEFWRTYHGDIDIMQNVSGGTYASEPYFINLEAFVQLATGRTINGMRPVAVTSWKTVCDTNISGEYNVVPSWQQIYSNDGGATWFFSTRLRNLSTATGYTVYPKVWILYLAE